MHLKHYSEKRIKTFSKRIQKLPKGSMAPEDEEAPEGLVLGP